MAKHCGKQSVQLERPPLCIGWAASVGKKEGEGPLGERFDAVYPDDTMGQDNWEQAESQLFIDAVKRCFEKSGLQADDVNMLLGGDLLNQLAASNFAGRALGLPFVGLFGACSTMAEALAVAAMILEGGSASRIACAASSHFCTAERQFRSPLELGNQRAPSTQWTVTGAGSVLLASPEKHSEPAPRVTALTIGKPVDYDIKDATNMGAAMAPAAADTLLRHFEDMHTSPDDYDVIATGDLGMIGSALLKELMREAGTPLPDGLHMDCGLQIFSPEQDVHAGGSGCGCSASVLCADLLPRLQRGEIKRLLFMATGALMSTTSANEGESIPSIAHAVVIERAEKPEGRG
ncbi:MAG: stage V sporulation protein AD [Oscillospiraceae bacterium]|jgi:stage V sporulation protein AD|nr:stage V sporulation protein AD [Oscillospiraceae bacterium]